MAKSTARIAVVQFVFALAVLAILARAAQLQLFQGERWAQQAARQRTERTVLPAKRGGLYDRSGVPLALTQEFYHVGVARNELADPRRAGQQLIRSLGIPSAIVWKDLRSEKRWLYYHGPYTATQVQPLRPLDGIHLSREFQRFYPARSLARPIIGGLSPDQPGGAAGLELSLDSILTGEPGEAVLLKDRVGRRYDSPSRLIQEPVAGNDVTLTLDTELQEIAERGLEQAVSEMRADGGDVVFLDSRNGELLALASKQAAGSSRASVFTDPFEPGSTAKLFTAAALLKLGRVTQNDAVFGEGGSWRMPVTTSGRTRTITDAHRTTGNLTLARAIQISSNIAMAKFSSRLSSEEQYETLRDFGFGAPTGVEFPSESRGRLERPDKWEPMYTRASVAMGYEFGVTPVQLAAAYAAIANNGMLLTPTLVREIRNPAGVVIYQHRPEPVRRVVTTEIAAKLREFLREAASEGGTGEEAQLANYTVLGKTGTSVRFDNGHYMPGEYTASFAALFPADDPQLVIIVKIDNPRGKYYGGLTAAPVTRTMLQQSLASRRIALERSDSAASAVPLKDSTARKLAATPSYVVLPWPFQPSDTFTRVRQVPAVEGEPVRQATLALHRSGFRVDLRGFGRVSRTAPAGGENLSSGSTVVVWTE